MAKLSNVLNEKAKHNFIDVDVCRMSDRGSAVTVPGMQSEGRGYECYQGEPY